MDQLKQKGQNQGMRAFQGEEDDPDSPTYPHKER